LATATTSFAISSVEDDFSLGALTWSTAGVSCQGGGGGVDETGADDDGGGPVALTQGDSGGGLFAQMSDGTWRLIAINKTDFPEFTSVWADIDFMLADPNIAENDIIPCHTQAGAWKGGAACTPAPTQPGVASGAWSSSGSNFVCANATSTRTDLCPPAIAPGSPAGYAAAGASTTPAASATSGSPGAQVGCRFSGPPTPLAVLLLSILLVLRRREEVR
jgi:hypothetical protein